MNDKVQMVGDGTAEESGREGGEREGGVTLKEQTMNSK